MKVAVINVERLSKYLAFEHWIFYKELEKLGWNIIDLNSEHLKNTISQSNAVLFGTYDELAFDLWGYRGLTIYKLDDLHYFSDEILKQRAGIIGSSDIIICPYQYIFHHYYAHGNVWWVPYSCADKFIPDFNEDPEPRILVTGASYPCYPFRNHLFGLDDNRIAKLNHPGYQRKYHDSDKCVGYDYFRLLNRYLCCFTDASIYKYVLLKNFEIAGSGSLLLTDDSIIEPMGKLGFIDGVNCIFSNLNNVREKISWILDARNRDEIDKIRINGMKLVKQYHLTSIRARSFDGRLQNHLLARGG